MRELGGVGNGVRNPGAAARSRIKRRAWAGGPGKRRGRLFWSRGRAVAGWRRVRDFCLRGRESLARCRLPVAVWSGGGVDWRGTRTLVYVFSRAPTGLVNLKSNYIYYRRNNINSIFFKYFYENLFYF